MEKIRATQNKLRRITDKPTHFDGSYSFLLALVLFFGPLILVHKSTFLSFVRWKKLKERFLFFLFVLVWTLFSNSLEIAPIPRVASFNSVQGSGYHTPVDHEEDNGEREDEFGSEFPSELGGLCIYPPTPQNQVIFW